MDLSKFFPTAFAQFFVWCSAFTLMTFGRAFLALLGVESAPLIETLTQPQFQMLAMGGLALLSVFLFWVLVRFVLVKHWTAKAIKILTTVVKYYTYWGLFQLFCVFLALAWA